MILVKKVWLETECEEWGLVKPGLGGVSRRYSAPRHPGSHSERPMDEQSGR